MDPANTDRILDLHEEAGLTADADVWHVLDQRLQDRDAGDRDNLGLRLVHAPERMNMVPRVAEVAMYYRGMLWTSTGDDEVAGEDVDGPGLLAQADQDGSAADEEE